MSSSHIPIHKTIKDLYLHLGLDIGNAVEIFHISKHEDLREKLPVNVPPFRNDFYEVSLVLGGTSLSYQINDDTFETPEKYLVFNAPGQVHKWEGIQGDLSGFVLFFHPAFLGELFRERALSDFPFFNIYEANLFELDVQNAEKFGFYYHQIFDNYTSGQRTGQELIKANLQAILWQCNQEYEERNKNMPERKVTDGITARYRKLVNENFLKTSTVNDYADMLNITPNYLSQTILQTLGTNAKSIIDNRLLLEAEYLLKHTDLSNKEIGYRLNFDEPTHFNRFFKKHRGTTPGQFRKSKS
ncbi:helix-turn-helix domain-containing protein [Flagellimonas meridianipacifica]|uniref:AraC-like DNA-binding protein n=1 Tax=Flagellimonas meridianipacifica TaxID=1080225 RepID=A0A2T0MBH3_9FLAO|nr:helix-turn-helix domain-containing protein [Allomuricauda pacifica]PRX54851.1 AraC-like DNA-binding protein [Allomuricauda pacifica]